MACYLCGTRPLPAPILIHREIALVKFQSKYTYFLLKKIYLRCCLQNVNHFGQTWMFSTFLVRLVSPIAASYFLLCISWFGHFLVVQILHLKMMILIIISSSNVNIFFYEGIIAHTESVQFVSNYPSMMMFSALLALCEGNHWSLVYSPYKGLVLQNVLFEVRLHKLLNK